MIKVPTNGWRVALLASIARRDTTVPRQACHIPSLARKDNTAQALIVVLTLYPHRIVHSVHSVLSIA